MLRKIFLSISWLVIFGFGNNLLGLSVRTSVNSIAHEGNYQTLGIFSILVNGNDFANASPDNPVYIRFRLVQSNGWSQSLVDLRPGAAPQVNQPINLAIAPPANGVALSGSLPKNAVQLVRFIKGETEGWIKVTYSSSQWISGGAPPSPENSVAISMGIRGQDSIQSGSNTPTGGNEYASSGTLASTVLRADYRNTPFFGNGDTEILDFLGLDGTTSGVEAGDTIVPGAILSFGFSNDLIVARGTFNFPCLDYHFDPQNFEASFPRIPISRINLVDFRKYGFNFPSVYLSNTSDFPWEQGTNLFLTLRGFNPDYVLAGISHPGAIDADQFPVSLSSGSVAVTSTDGSKWEVQEVFWDDQVAGYRFILLEGLFGLNQRLEISGIRGSVGQEFHGRGIILAAKAYYRNAEIIQENFGIIGPIERKSIELYEAEYSSTRKIIPYTAYDKSSWKFKLHVLNPNEEAIRYTALFYNRHGILLRILGNQHLDANAKLEMDIEDLFGQQAQGILSWVELLSEKQILAIGEIRDKADTILDIFPANDRLQETLYGIHLPSEIHTWQTSAYVVSADLMVDTEFNMTFPNTDPVRINSIFLPGGTAILNDNNFINGEGRQPWFEVQTPSESGAGLLFYSSETPTPQLVSVLMNTLPNKTWRFDHLGDPEKGWWNGLVLFNPAESDIRVTIRGLNANSLPIGESQIILPANSKHVGLAQNLISFTQDGTLSMVQLTSNSPFLSFLLLGRENQGVLTRISGNLNEYQHFRLAYLPRSEQEWLGLSLYNPTPVELSAQITLYDASGSVGPTTSVTLPAFGKSIFDLATLFGDITGFESLKIESQTPIRAFGITGNHAGTQLATVDPEPISQ